MDMIVIMKAGEIPEYATVTKKTGSIRYLLRNQIKVYNDSGLEQVISGDGVRYIVDETGNINAVSHEKELAWIVDAEALHCYLDTLLDGTPQ